MIRQQYKIEIITPCFAGGANPDKVAEIRPASIRGQLRWWFRVLGGFQSLEKEGKDLRKQEEFIFGAAADSDSRAGLLSVRTSGIAPSDITRDDVGMNARIYDPRGYFLFPLRATDQGNTRHDRAVFNPDLLKDPPSFTLTLVWRGNRALRHDLECLMKVFCELGSLGFRSRRAMGALALKGWEGCSLASALAAFSQPDNISVYELRARSDANAIDVLANWLKRWKAHGRSVDHSKNRNDVALPPLNTGFEWALRDHDEGYGVLGKGGHVPPAHGKIPNGNPGETFRSALGLPVVQGTQQGKVFWYPRYDREKARRDRSYKGEGRFASPVILRPHKDADGKWRALVIFVDSMKWQDGEKVYLNGQPKEVSLGLYEAMKADPLLHHFS